MNNEPMQYHQDGRAADGRASPILRDDELESLLSEVEVDVVQGHAAHVIADEHLINPPGKQTVGDHEPLADALTLMMLQNKVHLLPKGKMGPGWKLFEKVAFRGHVTPGGEFVPGVMAGYKRWTSQRPHDKFRAMVDNMVEHYSQKWIDKGGKDATDLETRAFGLMRAKEAVVRAAAKKSAAKKRKEMARKTTNEAEEVLMGLRVPSKPSSKKSASKPRDSLGGKTHGKAIDLCLDIGMCSLYSICYVALL